MKFHNITHDDMLNGDGIRVVLWVSGCSHHCKGCQNPVTWDPDDGIQFEWDHFEEIMRELKNDYVSGLTISGGDPLHISNRRTIGAVCVSIKAVFPDKTIWLYTGYEWEEIKNLELLKYVDVIVDGPFIEELADINYHWAGSTNQRVIDVQKSLQEGGVVLWDSQRSETGGNTEDSNRSSKISCGF